MLRTAGLLFRAALAGWMLFIRRLPSPPKRPGLAPPFTRSALSSRIRFRRRFAPARVAFIFSHMKTLALPEALFHRANPPGGSDSEEADLPFCRGTEKNQP